MELNILFIFNSILLGAGLAADAFSVSLANGLNEPSMKKPRMMFISGTFGVFQFAMPLIGWTCVHTIMNYFTSFQKFIPWIALILLLYIGGKMLIDGIKDKHDEEEERHEQVTGTKMLMVQGIATSIDALSVGFTIAEYGFLMALLSTVIIGAVTFIICMFGLAIGKKFGTKLASKASILGGLILIGIGIEIFISGIF